MKRFKAALLVLMLTLGILVVTAPAAEAAGCSDGTRQNITHYSPDAGYNAPFYIEGYKCRSDGTKYLTTGYIYVGQSAYGNGWLSAERIYTNGGAMYKCLDPILLVTGVQQWQTTWSDTGWHNVGTYPWYFSRTCVYQLD